MKKNLILTIGVLFASALFHVALATPPPPSPNDIPIDGGVSLLFAISVGYGAKKIYDARKKNNNTTKEQLNEEVG